MQELVRTGTRSVRVVQWAKILLSSDQGLTDGAPKSLNPPHETLVALKVSRECKEWRDRFAAHCRFGVSVSIEQALMHYAKVRGFDGPPKR